MRDTVVEIGLEACSRADRSADDFLSNHASISPTHTMDNLFELLVVHDDATVNELLDANNVCIGALALSWEVHAGFTPEATCWLIRVQSGEDTWGDAEYLSLFTGGNGADQADVDARFGELAEASGATPNDLFELLDGLE